MSRTNRDAGDRWLTEELTDIKADTLLYAIGDDPEEETLKGFGLEPGSRGYVTVEAGEETGAGNVFLVGDVRTGPSTIVKCISEGRKTADANLPTGGSGLEPTFYKTFLGI